MSYRIGFASLDGTRVDQHFGSARHWQIYDVDCDGAFVEARKTDAHCQGHCEGGFEHILAVLDDCDAVFAARIGQGAAAFMLQRGKRVFEAVGEIDAIVEHLIENDLMREWR